MTPVSAGAPITAQKHPKREKVNCPLVRARWLIGRQAMRPAGNRVLTLLTERVPAVTKGSTVSLKISASGSLGRLRDRRRDGGFQQVSMQSPRLSRDDLISLVPQFVVRERISAVRFIRLAGQHLRMSSLSLQRDLAPLWTQAVSTLRRHKALALSQAALAAGRMQAFGVVALASLPSLPPFRLPARIEFGRPVLPAVTLPGWFDRPRAVLATHFKMKLPLRRMLGTVAVLSIAGGFAITLLSGGSSQAVKPESGVQIADKPAEPTKPKPPEWSEIRHPVLQFALDMPQADRAPFQQRLFRSSAGEREETLAWGAPSAMTLYAQITVHHASDTPLPDDGLVVALARRAAANGIAITRISAPTSLSTKFGDLETADAELQTERAERSCLVFRHQRTDSSFGIAGWYCGSSDKPAERTALGCLIDRLDLMAAGDDVQLQQIFAAAGRQRGRCPSNRTDPRRLAGLEIDSRPQSFKPTMGPPIPTTRAISTVRRHRHRNR